MQTLGEVSSPVLQGEETKGKLIVANWKMNVPELGPWKDFPKFSSEVVIAPPFSHLKIVPETIPNIYLGAQDTFFEENGAYTGEVSPELLKEVGVKYVIVGHSERRAMGETDEIVNKKAQAALKDGLRVILCIGETKEAKDGDTAPEFIKNQTEKALQNIEPDLFQNLIVAYEPVWAISTAPGAEADAPDHALQMIQFIKGLNPAFVRSRFIYGGSVTPENATGYLNMPGIEGALVGGASLDIEKFKAILTIADARN